MTSTTTLRWDTARTGTTPEFPFNGGPWRKYISMNLGASMRAGVLVVENWEFNQGPHNGKTYTLVLAATTTNEVYCFSEGQLLAHGSGATPLWQTSFGVTPMQRMGSNIAPPLGVCGTPVVDTANRRMFVVAMWQDGAGNGHYTIFELALDTGAITTSQELVDAGAPGRATYNPDSVDQRGAINLAGGWLWVGFADFYAYDAGEYYGWVVAINPNQLDQQLYQPMVSLNTTETYGMYAGGVWGPGGVAAAPDGTVYALTGNATNDPESYWQNLPAAGPGSLGDYFQALVRLGVNTSGSTPELTVLDWFQGSMPDWLSGKDFTQAENDADFDFGGSSPVVLPPIDGRQLVAFVPKDGDLFVLDSANLGHFSTPLARQPFANALLNGGNDSKVAIAFFQTPDERNVLVVGADSNGSLGGVAAFELDGSVTPPTLTKLWQAPTQLRDSFGSPLVIANPVPDPSNPPSPLALAWIIDGDPDNSSPGQNYQNNCAMRAYDPLTGTVVYDSTVHNDVTEDIPNFTPITAGANSLFCATLTGFIGFTQFVVPTKTLTFIVDKSTFGKDEVDAMEAGGGQATFNPAYWLVVSGVLPDDIGVTASNLTPTTTPGVTAHFDPSLSAAQVTVIKNMLNAGTFTGQVVPESPGVPDEPQAFMFPYTVSFTGDNGFVEMAAGPPIVNSTLVTLDAAVNVGTPLANSTQIELTTGADPFFVDVNPSDPTQPTWLSFDLRLFSVTEGTSRFGAPAMSSDPADAPGFIASAITNLNANNGNVGGDSFDNLSQDEDQSALEWNPTDNAGNAVFNFALARVRLVGKTTGPTPTPVRVFFRLFQAQGTTSQFDTSTTYRTWADPSPFEHKIALLGVQNDEYVTVPCFASARKNLNAAVSMDSQDDPPNAYPINIVTAGVEVDSFFGCWIDNNQPQQKFLPASPPPAAQGGLDGPWTSQLAAGTLQSLHSAITVSPHHCLIAEINYDATPVPATATTATSDKLAQRNIAWIDGPNPGQVGSRRMPHPVQARPTPRGSANPDELMIFWGATPEASHAQLFLPAVDAAQISDLANDLRSWQHTWVIDPHTIGFDAKGVTFVPLPSGIAPLAGLLTVTLPPGIRRGAQYTITVRQLTDEVLDVVQPPPSKDARVGTLKPTVISRRVVGAFQFGITIKSAEAILLNEERLLATLRALAIDMPTSKRWYPVLQRYVEYVIGRVEGFGGDPTKIRPSPVGWVPGLPKRDEFVGWIEALIFDHAGEFEGFVLETETGHRHEFFSRERGIREVAEHAQDRHRRVRVIAEEHHPDRIRRIMIL
jgi:hypothetical protein